MFLEAEVFEAVTGEKYKNLGSPEKHGSTSTKNPHSRHLKRPLIRLSALFSVGGLRHFVQIDSSAN